jgi:hypothetical protein
MARHLAFNPAGPRDRATPLLNPVLFTEPDQGDNRVLELAHQRPERDWSHETTVSLPPQRGRQLARDGLTRPPIRAVAEPPGPA